RVQIGTNGLNQRIHASEHCAKTDSDDQDRSGFSLDRRARERGSKPPSELLAARIAGNLRESGKRFIDGLGCLGALTDASQNARAFEMAFDRRRVVVEESLVSVERFFVAAELAERVTRDPIG